MGCCPKGKTYVSTWIKYILMAVNFLFVMTRRFKRQRVFWVYVILLYLLTFLLVLPLVSLVCRHTLYDFMIHYNTTQETAKLQQANLARYKEAVNYLRSVNTSKDIDRNPGSSHSTEKGHADTEDSYPLSVAITIVTVSRNRQFQGNRQPMYLTQTVAAFLKLLEKNDHLKNMYRLFVCNVDGDPDSYTELHELPSWIPVFQKFDSKHPRFPVGLDQRLEKERGDYVFCLRQSLEQKVSHLLLLEDDAYPLDDLFPVLNVQLSRQFTGPHSAYRNITFVKLYHPERIAGYINLEAERIPELIASSCLLSTFLVLVVSSFRRKLLVSQLQLWVVFFVYSCLFLLVLGRPNLNEFRRLSVYLYQLTPTPSCCMPAMLYPRHGGKIVADYLSSIHCKTGFGKDTALDQLRQKQKLVGKMIQPNLFKHIGQYSSLRRSNVDPLIV